MSRTLASEIERLFKLEAEACAGSEWLYSEGGKTGADENFEAAAYDMMAIIRTQAKRLEAAREALRFYAGREQMPKMRKLGVTIASDALAATNPNQELPT